MNLPPFHNPALLARAFTHRSYLNEHPDSGEDNERLEFLGDAVLDFVSGSFLYQRYPTMSEGQLTRVRSALVRAERLAALAEKFDLGDQLRMGKGEEETGGRERVSMLGDAFEAVIGALYLDAGLEAVRAFVEPLFAPLAETILQAEHDQDAKSYFQEIAQAEYRHTPRYRTIAAEGPEHERMFTVEVVVGENVFGAGQGRNKNAATQAAARNALERLTPRRLLITGASGYVGGQLMNAARLWTVTGTYFSRPFTPRAGSIATALDLTDFNAARQIMTDARPTAIIHTACSNRGDLSAIISAARNLATLADEQGIRLVHLSTDLVFDGEHAPYPDDAPLRPLMDYGKAKAEAEALVLELCPSAVIVRPSLVWGAQPA
jgi:ribonuclease-3